MKQDQMQFANACIFDKMIWPEDNAWIYELIKEAEKKRKELDKTIGNMIN